MQCVAHNIIQYHLIVYHTESPGIESDVHRFIQQYGISAEEYQEPLLALALERLQHLRSTAPRRQALAGAPLGEQARVQQGNGFGDDYDDEEEEDDEEEDALEEGNEGGWGDGETHQSESPAPTSPSPRVEEKASRPSIEKKKNLEKRDELTRPPPIEHTRSTISRVDDDVKVEGIGQVKSRGKSSIDQVKEDEDWAEEDAEHDMLPNAAASMPRPKSAPPQQTPQQRGRGIKLGSLSLTIPSGKAKIAVEFPYYTLDTRDTLAEAAEALVRRYKMGVYVWIYIGIYVYIYK